jgi:hypothetical protein
MKTALLIGALALLGPQQDWPSFGGKNHDDMGISIDPGSIQRTGDLRTAQGRLTRVGQENRYIQIDLRIDCAARKASITRFVGYENGAPLPGGEDREELDFTRDALGSQVIGYLCRP